ncbi:MAG: hypothetical protein LBL66_00815 [Clostridiales bacterium]|jgi:vacuolar-type H+-ATPase subunit E/Vma4|nr:hypothetical protein [Clostridiales bacterium]
MNEKVIIEKIARDAETRAEALIAEARAEAERTLAVARAEIESRRAVTLAEAKRDAETLIKNRLALAELDVRRAELKARQDEIGGVYASVKRNLLLLSGEGYRDLICKMLYKYAEDGDTVVAGAADLKKIDRALIEGVAKSKKIGLALSPEPGAFDGLKLANAVCDKNLTFDGLLNELRSETETAAVKIIEGGVGA